ncbi:MAG: hypothetical protein OHK0037_30660 [Elainellaceae cyanobacterium]
MARRIAPPAGSSAGWLQPLDRVAWVMMAVLLVLTGLLLAGGDHASPRVRDFSWDGRQVGAEDRAFLMTFSRPMDRQSVEQNLRIEPPLAGKVSWAGRRMAYTLDTPAPYGTEYQVRLRGARDRFNRSTNTNLLQPFESTFRTRDRAFVYLGAEGDEAGRLVLQNLSRDEKTILTPPDLGIFDYEPYPEGDRILFSAVDRKSRADDISPFLYTVTTGLLPEAPAATIGEIKAGELSRGDRQPQPAGVIQLVLGDNEYQNLKFDLSPDGQRIAVQRVNKQNPAEFGLWAIEAGQPAKPVPTEPGGDFLIAPDGRTLAMAQGEGMAILSLTPEADEAEEGKPLDFLPQYGVVLSFSNDGTAAAMVGFNRDPQNPTRSLFLVTNQGQEKELLTTDGSIFTAQFDPTNSLLYCLVSTRIPGDIYIEQPYLVAINLKSGIRTDLLKLPIQRDIQVALAPDGLGLLFDQVVSASDDVEEGIAQGSDGRAIATSRLWFLPLQLDQEGNPQKVAPQALAVPGLRPRWMP